MPRRFAIEPKPHPMAGIAALFRLAKLFQPPLRDRHERPIGFREDSRSGRDVLLNPLPCQFARIPCADQYGFLYGRNERRQQENNGNSARTPWDERRPNVPQPQEDRPQQISSGEHPERVDGKDEEIAHMSRVSHPGIVHCDKARQQAFRRPTDDQPPAKPHKSGQRSLSVLMYRTMAQAASKVNSAIRTSGFAMRDEKL